MNAQIYRTLATRWPSCQIDVKLNLLSTLSKPGLFKVSHACENYVSFIARFSREVLCGAQSLTAVFGFEK